MTYTIVPSHKDSVLATENVVNRITRHCRIVGVKWKVAEDRSYRSLLDWKPEFPYQPIFNNWVPHQCRGCEGNACGNVACPMRPMVTCGPNTGYPIISAH